MPKRFYAAYGIRSSFNLYCYLGVCMVSLCPIHVPCKGPRKKWLCSSSSQRISRSVGADGVASGASGHSPLRLHHIRSAEGEAFFSFFRLLFCLYSKSLPPKPCFKLKTRQKTNERVGVFGVMVIFCFAKPFPETIIVLQNATETKWKDDTTSHCSNSVT